MYRILTAIALSGLLLSNCEPTPRTAGQKKRARITSSASENQKAQAPEQHGEKTPAEPAPAPQAESSANLLGVSATLQDYNLLRPWEKKKASNSQLMGVYLGNGQVLTYGDGVKAATYVEISLPDGSRTAPAKVLRYDRDLNLALLTVAHEKDASIFDTREPLELGEPLRLGDAADFLGVVRGLVPVRIALVAESSATEGVAPRLNLQVSQPVPQGGAYGLPIVRDGRLVGITAGYQQQTQTLLCINAELIARFLAEPDGSTASSAVLGISSTDLDDPVFRAYLRLQEGQGGIYVFKVEPGGAAEEAGIAVGDVITSVDGLAIDAQGRCTHPLYGPIDARAVLRMLKPQGESLKLTVSRHGESREVVAALNRKAMERSLYGVDAPGEQPRYAMWGGLLFQPLTSTYISTLRAAAKNSLPVQFLELEGREEEFRAKGVTELVALTQVIPTPATLSYDSLGYCVVEAVNGKPVHDFAEFARLLDEPTKDGLVSFTLNKAPYTIYLDRRTAETCNIALQRSAINPLRVVAEKEAGTPKDKAEAPAPTPPAADTSAGTPPAPAEAAQERA